jgi:aryl-alcohol dehydrogenase-like predicted oxidoreductase
VRTRRLGKDGPQVSILGAGTWSYGGGSYWGEQAQEDVNAVVAKAIDLGVNYFDTAEMYNDGASETSLGIAFSGRRDEIIIGTKLSPSNCQPDAIRAHLDASLERLQTDHVDIYMLHWPIEPHAIEHFTADEATIANPPSVATAMETLAELREEGKIGYIGVSNHGVEQMAEILDTGVEIVCNEMMYNLFARAIEAEILPFCARRGIGVIGYMALLQGILAGAYEHPDQVPPAQAHSRHFAQERGWDEINNKNWSRHGESGCEQEMDAAMATLRELSSNEGISVAQLAIAWAMDNENIATTLVGSRNVKELEENVAAVEYQMSENVRAALDEASMPIWEKLGNNPDYYENPSVSRIH